MVISIAQLKAEVAEQASKVPQIYGDVDFEHMPERFTDDPANCSIPVKFDAKRRAYASDSEMVESMRQYVLLGDTVCDAYGALLPKYGIQRLIGMLMQACDRGVESVADAPPELVAFIRSMEQTPDWIDMDLVKEGARLERNRMAHSHRFFTRAAFTATFMNKYAALPMALTGKLGNESALRRMHETAAYFATSMLPGALERNGPGFKVSAMVRLMHSSVRFNLMRAKKVWNREVYGIPIPQLDQMAAAMISSNLTAQRVLASGRLEFNDQERAVHELSRYRGFLLGLPRELLPQTAKEVEHMCGVRLATLREGWDETTCGELLRATMAVNLAPNNSLVNRIIESIERRSSRVLFLKTFMYDDRAAAAKVGVDVQPLDYVAMVAVGLTVRFRMSIYRIAQHLPGIRQIADRRLVTKLGVLLKKYGHAEFTSDGDTYRPTRGAAVQATA